MTAYAGPERRKQPRTGWWRCSWCGVLAMRIWSLFAYSDTTPTRGSLALAASVWVVILILPGNTFSAPAYSYIREVFGSNAETVWAVMWMLYALLMWWRLFSSSGGAVIGIAVNAFGCALFWTVLASLFLARIDPVPGALAPNAALALAAAWVLVRTNINSEAGWRRD